jgi:hypothetical protein
VATPETLHSSLRRSVGQQPRIEEEDG